MHLAWRIGIERPHGADRDLEVTGEVVDSKLVADLHKLRGVAFLTIFGDGDQLVVAIEEVEGFDDQVDLHAVSEV